MTGRCFQVYLKTGEVKLLGATGRPVPTRDRYLSPFVILRITKDLLRPLAANMRLWRKILRRPAPQNDRWGVPGMPYQTKRTADIQRCVTFILRHRSISRVLS